MEVDLEGWSRGKVKGSNGVRRRMVGDWSEGEVEAGSGGE